MKNTIYRLALLAGLCLINSTGAFAQFYQSPCTVWDLGIDPDDPLAAYYQEMCAQSHQTISSPDMLPPPGSPSGPQQPDVCALEPYSPPCCCAQNTNCPGPNHPPCDPPATGGGSSYPCTWVIDASGKYICITWPFYGLLTPKPSLVPPLWMDEPMGVLTVAGVVGDTRRSSTPGLLRRL